MAHLEELLQFLSPSARFDVKSAACMTVAQLTGTSEGLQLLSLRPDILTAVIGLIKDPEIYTAKDAMRTLINLSAEESGASALLALKDVDVTTEMIKCIQDKEYPHADYACGVLANLSKPKQCCQKVFESLDKGPVKLEGLVYILCQMNYNTKGAKLHLLAPCITNFSQLADGRRCDSVHCDISLEDWSWWNSTQLYTVVFFYFPDGLLVTVDNSRQKFSYHMQQVLLSGYFEFHRQMMDRNSLMIQRLIPFMEYKESKGRRFSIIAAIHNCCFEKENHTWLMGEDIDIIPRLVLPLAGPDVYTVEENDSLPVDLQYLGDDKEREPDPEIRKLLLEALMQMCITRNGREIMRSQNIYLILKEHHKWETDRRCIMLNEDLVNLIIRTEEEIGVEDLSTVEVSSDLAKKFLESDREYLAGDMSDIKEITEDSSKDRT